MPRRLQRKTEKREKIENRIGWAGNVGCPLVLLFLFSLWGGTACGAVHSVALVRLLCTTHGHDLQTNAKE